MTRVVVYTAPGCHLCTHAVEAVREVCGEDFDLVDITSDPRLEERYRTWIPVVKVDGVERFRYELAADDLAALLS
jgi:glutaredoxin